MNSSKYLSILQALIVALLFGLTAPMTKLLLGDIQPLPLAAFLYLGSGIGLVILRAFQRLGKNHTSAEAGIKKEDIKWLAGAVIAGGIIAPIILMFSLNVTPATTASLLTNFESVATTLIAVLIFKEAIGKRIWFAVASVTAASILLSWNPGGELGFSIGALGILGACALWGLDNNLTRNISAKDPLSIVSIKGFGAGLFSLLLAIILKNPLPDFKTILGLMVLGFIFYGLSIVLLVLAMRSLGASRASAFLGISPFVGVLVSFLLFRELPNTMFYISLPIMVIGAILLLSEEHNHMHKHEPITHEHRHNHTDGHHNHKHEGNMNIVHSHIHTHDAMEHSHPHTPDIHHRHRH